MTVVAIDGPSAAGKSTVARAVARRLGWRYLDTGALYRAVALAALRDEVDPHDEGSVGRIAASAEIEADHDRVELDGVDVTARVRADDVTGAVSAVAAHRVVRSALRDRQRDAARRHDVVIEGRDIGTAIAPDARVKVWLTASLPERARRRCAQRGLECDDTTLRRIERELAARDDADSSRAASPLRRPPDALEIDSTDKSVDEVADEIVARVRTVARAEEGRGAEEGRDVG
jgi:cytidylate kinase